MKTVQEYMRRAAECEILAAAAVSNEQKNQIAGIAQTWRSLAIQREQLLRDTSSNQQRQKPQP
jgi:hypothetical protein